METLFRKVNSAFHKVRDSNLKTIDFHIVVTHMFQSFTLLKVKNSIIQVVFQENYINFVEQ